MLYVHDGRRFAETVLRAMGVSEGDEAGLGFLVLDDTPPPWNPRFDRLLDAGTITVDGIPRIDWQVVERGVDEVKAELKAAVAAMRWQREVAGVGFDGWTVQTDRESRSVLASMVWQDGDAWKDTAGTFRPLTAERFAAMRAAVTAHVRACFEREASLAGEIDACTTVAQLRAIGLTVGWP